MNRAGAGNLVRVAGRILVLMLTAIRMIAPEAAFRLGNRMLAITAWESVRQGVETAGQAISAQAA